MAEQENAATLDARTRTRWIVTVATRVVLAALVVLNFVQQRSWHWGPFALGFSACVVGALVVLGFAAGLRRRVAGQSPSGRLKSFLLANTVLWLTAGLGIGTMSSMWNSPWPGVAVLAYDVFLLALSVVAALHASPGESDTDSVASDKGQ